ncbi:hypothetical protein Tco_0396063 [Tanacetum coccineum]
MKKDFEIYKGKKARVKSIALKAKKKSSDDETSTSRSDDEEYAMAIRNFKKCGDLNHLICDCPKPPRNKDQKAFIGGSWSDSENDAEDKTNDKTCLMDYSSNEFAKKQTALAISMTEAEYVSARKACQQALWMKQALIDYDIRLDDVPIMCDNKGAIDLSKNPVQHSRTNHIEIRHHFLRDNVRKGNISIEKVASEDNIPDIFTKP